MRLRTKDEIKNYSVNKQIQEISIEKTGSELKGRFEKLVIRFTDNSVIRIESQDSEDYSSSLEFFNTDSNKEEENEEGDSVR